MVESAQTLLGREIRVQFKYFVHVHTTVQLAELGRAKRCVTFLPFSDLLSAAHLYKSVRGIFQSVLRLYYCLAFDYARV